MYLIKKSIISYCIWVNPWYFYSSQCSMTGITKAGVCYPVYWMAHIKEPLLLIQKSSPKVAAVGFLSHYLNGPLPYIQHYLTINKTC